MQENNELKDILLEKEDDVKSAKLKKLLVTIAAFSILFLVVIAVMKMINSNDNENLSNDVDSRLVLPSMPDEKVVDLGQNKKDKEDVNKDLFEQVPILPENKSQDDFEEMVKKLKEKDNPIKIEETAQKDVKPVVIKEAVELKKEEPANTEVKEEKYVKKPGTKDIKKTEPKKEVKLDKPEPKKQEVKKQTKPENKANSSIQPGNYVQVSATTKAMPDSRELSKITSKGYSYKLLRINDVTKVIIGPFGSNLQTELNKIRKDINKGAFVYKVK